LSGLLRRNPRSRLSGADTEKLLAAVAQGAGTSRLRLLGRQVGWRGPALPAVAGADPEDDAFAPPPVADTDAVPDAATPRLDGPPGIERGISRSTAIALLLLTVLVAGLAAYGAQAVIVGHGPARHPSPSAPRTAAGPPTAVVLSTPGPGEEALP